MRADPAPKVPHGPPRPYGARAPRPLTNRQRFVLAAISTYIREKGYPPGVRDLCAVLSIRSTNGANEHLRALEYKGMLTRTACSARGIRLTRAAIIELREDLSEPTATSRSMSDMVSVTKGDGSGSINIEPQWTCGQQQITAWISTSTIAKAGIFPGAMVMLAPVEATQLRTGDVVLVRVDQDCMPALRKYRRGFGIHTFEADATLGVVFPDPLDPRTVLGRAVSIYRSL